MAKKAEAWKEYGSAAMVDMMLETLPKVSILCNSDVSYYYTHSTRSDYILHVILLDKHDLIIL